LEVLGKQRSLYETTTAGAGALAASSSLVRALDAASSLLRHSCVNKRVCLDGFTLMSFAYMLLSFYVEIRGDIYKKDLWYLRRRTAEGV
jgi:hypothetical protein